MTISALSANSNTIKAVLPGTIQLPVATAVQIYQGAIVSIDISGTPGYAEPGSDTASTVPYGIAENMAPPSGVGTAGASGTYSVNVTPFTVQPLVEVNYGSAGASAVTADIGKYVYLANDNCVDLHGVTSNDICLGKIVQIVSTSRVVVDTRIVAALVTGA